MKNEIPKFIDARRFAQESGRSLSSVKRDTKSGRIPSTKIGKTVLIPSSFLGRLERKAYLGLDGGDLGVVNDE